MTWRNFDKPRMTTFEGELAPPPDPRKPRFTTLDEGGFMETKSLLSSKLNWLGLFTAVMPFISPLMDAIPPQYKPFAVAAVGIGTIVLRTFFTSQPVSMPGSDKPLATPPSGG